MANNSPTPHSSVTRTLPSYIPDVELIGEWDTLENALPKLNAAIERGVKKGQESAARKLYDIVRKNIRNHGAGLGWEPVSDKYAEYKKHRGGDPAKFMMLSRTYYDSVLSWESNGRYYVGVKRNVYNTFSKSRITVGRIAQILERGRGPAGYSGRIKARPLWTPSYKEFGGIRTIRSLIVWHVQREIKATGLKVKVK